MPLVMAGCAGSAGAGILARQFAGPLGKRFPAFLMKNCLKEGGRLLIREAAREALLAGSVFLVPVSHGGVLAALWEMGEIAGCGLEADIRRIPIRQETIEICEYLDGNPYQLYGQGALLCACRRPEALCESLREAGWEAEVIGCLTKQRARILRNGEEIRYLEKPQPDAWQVMIKCNIGKCETS